MRQVSVVGAAFVVSVASSEMSAAILTYNLALLLASAIGLPTLAAAALMYHARRPGRQLSAQH
jgi:hypothetical protein